MRVPLSQYQEFIFKFLSSGTLTNHTTEGDRYVLSDSDEIGSMSNSDFVIVPYSSWFFFLIQMQLTDSKLIMTNPDSQCLFQSVVISKSEQLQETEREHNCLPTNKRMKLKEQVDSDSLRAKMINYRCSCFSFQISGHTNNHNVCVNTRYVQCLMQDTAVFIINVLFKGAL